MPSDNYADVVVVGAGISGLMVAHCLEQRGLGVHVLEKSERVGGTIRTESIDGFLVEYGPNSALETSPVLGQLFSQTGVADSLVYAADAAKARYVVRRGRLNTLPTNPIEFIRSGLFSTRAKLRLLREPFVRPLTDDEDESMAAFVRRRLGPEFLDYAIDPFVSGVYAGSPELLSVRSSFPKLVELERNHGSLVKGAIKGAQSRRARATRVMRSKADARMFSFGNGMETLVRGLSMQLGKAIHTEAEPVAIRPSSEGYTVNVRTTTGEQTLTCRSVVLTVPAYSYPAIDLLRDTGLAESLSQIPYAPVTVVFFGYERKPACVDTNGFGFLVPAKENRRILGSIWNSSIFPDRTPRGGLGLTTFLGGSRQPQIADLDDGALVDLVRSELRDFMGMACAPDVVGIKHWKRAIPQYNVGHSRIMDSVEAFEHENPGLFVSGNFRNGVSLSDCVVNAFGTAERVADQLERRGATSPDGRV